MLTTGRPAKLLRGCSRTARSEGSARTALKRLDQRVVVATNRSLDAEAAAGRRATLVRGTVAAE